jgi:hypothetical protein
VVNNDFKETTESLEVKLFNEEDIPWEELAFPFVPTILKSYFQDVKNNDFPLRTQTIERPKNPDS